MRVLKIFYKARKSPQTADNDVCLYKMVKMNWKKVIVYIGIMIFFLVLSYGFVPQVIGGKIVNQSDISGYVGMAHEANEWNAQHPDDRTAWTNSMFGGMPTVMITGNPEGDWTQKIYDAFLTGKRPATYLFISLAGAFLLMLSLGVNVLIAVGGAIAVTFCSYNMQIIQVGHNTKMMAIAWLPWVLAAVIFTYKTSLGLYYGGKATSGDRNQAVKSSGPDGNVGTAADQDEMQMSGWKVWLSQTVLGSALFGMALNFQLKANHIQISYYLAIIIFCYVIGLFVWLMTSAELRRKTGRFFTASALLLVLGIVGIGANANKLIPTYRYSKHTMRGGSELAEEAENQSGGKTNGLDLEYATAWSYGWHELPNMMIPNFNGGSSAGAMNPSKSETIKLLKKYGQGNLREVSKSLPLYWGPQPFTAGPMYMGAITVFLFLIGLFLCRGRDKWWILAATVIAVFLALGSHFMPFTKFWYEHMPFYSKFRTVSMSLVILQATLPMLAFTALDRILKGEVTEERFKRPGLIAFLLTGGVCCLFVLFPGIAGDFSAASDSGMNNEIVSALQSDRAVLLRSDAIVSLILVSLTYLLIRWAYSKPEKAPDSYTSDFHIRNSRSTEAGAAICIMVLINMFSVGKRYLNADHFITPRNFNGQFFQRPVDKAILEDNELDYRVLDLTANVFNDSHASYWHKSVGGYSPVKLQRYQDLIDRHLTGEINSVINAINAAQTKEELMANFPEIPVLSMLNDKYIIVGANVNPIVNDRAFGNAWFVDAAALASSANEEISMLSEVDLRNVAVIGPDFGWAAEKIAGLAAQDTIYMTSYAPNELRYHYRAASDRAVIFSEIYYPDGWTLKIADEQESGREGNESMQKIEIFRANWTLRGAVLPAGEHDIVMRFDPESYQVSSNISRASSALLILLILLSTGGMFFPARKKEDRKIAEK